MSLVRQDLDQLRAKYSEMLAMRLAHESGLERPDEVRVRMASLASRFPGALREIDELELDDIRARVAKLEGVLSGARAVEPWMEAIALFHALSRGVLHAKRWLGGRKRAGPEVERAFAAYVEALDPDDDARRWVGELDSVAAPPRGRLTALVYARMAVAIRVTNDEARRLVFGEGRRSRRMAR